MIGANTQTNLNADTQKEQERPGYESQETEFKSLGKATEHQKPSIPGEKVDPEDNRNTNNSFDQERSQDTILQLQAVYKRKEAGWKGKIDFRMKF